MMFIRSTQNGCTYILSEDEDLMYHPLLTGGLAETARSAYIYVDIDVLDEDTAKEAFRCHNLLLESLEE